MFSQKIANLTVALAADHPACSGAKICACLAYRNKPISFGFNCHRSHPLQAKYRKGPHNIFIHAEIDAIKNATKKKVDIERLTLYIARTLKNSRQAIVEPCAGCARAIAAFGITEVYHTTENGWQEWSS